MKILFMTNVPSPYRVDFFNELGNFCDLTVTFEKRTSDERDISWKNYTFKNFKGVFLNGKSISADQALCPNIIRYVKNEAYDRIVCTDFTSPTGILAICYMRKHKIPYYLECDGGFAKNGNGIKEKLKRYIITGAKGYLSTGDKCDEYYLKYGADSRNLIRYSFTSLHRTDILPRLITSKERNEIKFELGISEPEVVLTVGQFIHRKGFDILLRATTNLPKNIGVYFVGGIPTDDYLAYQAKHKLANVHFVGYRDKTALSLYYKAANIFVLPTREDIWGLVINEAMAHGLPVITTNRCGAGLEMISDGENGYIVATDNPVELRDKIIQMFSDNDHINRMAQASLDKAKEYTIERMVAEHHSLFEEMKESVFEDRI